MCEEVVFPSRRERQSCPSQTIHRNLSVVDTMALAVRGCQAVPPTMPKGDQQPDLALATVLRRLREARGESQEALAYRAGVSGGTLARIELGQASPAWATVRDIAEALNVSLVTLAKAVEREGRR